jgi:hypothetical protein
MAENSISKLAARLRQTTDAVAEDPEREAIQAEPELPQAGTPERERHDWQHHMVVAGLLRSASQRPSPSARIPDHQPQETEHGQ